MTNYTIQDFWLPRLGSPKIERSENLIEGWSFQSQGLPTFKEAPLTLSEGFGDHDDPMTSSLLLVSAPGAVGKTTLARQIAFRVGAVYVDLSKAEPVGANALTGGMVNSGLYDDWSNGSVAVLIDGLDEARLRVTQEAFEAFLSDVAKRSVERSVPTILFGRTGAVQDAWLVLTDHTANVPVLEIGYYGPKESIDFAESCLRASKPATNYQTVEREALTLLLQQLRDQTESEGDRFAGYAPVLQAVAKQVEDETDCQSLISRINEGLENVTLRTIAWTLLEREQRKLRDLNFEDKTLASRLYSPDEQLERLVSKVYGCPPPQLPSMSAADERTYTTALETWVGDHAFLENGSDLSSAVFGAMVCTKALHHDASAQSALKRELVRGAAANPFLFEFYAADSNGTVLAEHIGVIYASLRAGLSLGDGASLLVTGPESLDDEDDLQADVDIVLARQKQDFLREMHFETTPDGTIVLGTHVEDVDIIMPMSRVEIGQTAETVLVAPVNIQCRELTMSTDKVIVESPSRHDSRTNVIYIEAEDFDNVSAPSAVNDRRGNVKLSACWPGARVYPWTRFATEPSPAEDPRLDEALRRFRHFVIAFRSHGRRELARSANKIESTRMTKGTGQSVLDLMKSEGIVELRGHMYVLDQALLADITGTNYADCVARHFSDEAIDFVQRAL